MYHGYVLEIMCAYLLRVHVQSTCMNRHWDGLTLFWKVDLQCMRMVSVHTMAHIPCSGSIKSGTTAPQAPSTCTKTRLGVLDMYTCMKPLTNDIGTRYRYKYVDLLDMHIYASTWYMVKYDFLHHDSTYTCSILLFFTGQCSV